MVERLVVQQKRLRMVLHILIYQKQPVQGINLKVDLQTAQMLQVQQLILELFICMFLLLMYIL